MANNLRTRTRDTLSRMFARKPILRRHLTRAVLTCECFLARRCHPIDRELGIFTQAYLPAFLCKPGSRIDRNLETYAGCVPSALRMVLNLFSDEEVKNTSFLDLGCGLGRALAVASERPFARLLGIELTPELVEAARHNARHIRRRFPSRTSIEVQEGDASQPPLPAGNVFIFMYNPFDEVLTAKLIEHIMLTARGDVTIISENPLRGGVFDADERFNRCFVGMSPLTSDEREFSFEVEESIAVWRLGSPVTFNANVSGTIEVVKPGFWVAIRQLAT